MPKAWVLLAAAMAACAGSRGAAPDAPPPPRAECPFVEASGPSVVVIDADTLQHLCDATVEGTVEGERVAFEEMDWNSGLRLKGTPEGCFYVAWANHPGSYRITASHPGYETATLEQAAAGWNGCRVTGEFEVVVHPRPPAP
jgi:hypothetical protein